jgi:FMN reductase
MRIAVVVGNPKPDSRTLRIAESLAQRIAETVGGAELFTVDLATVAGRLFDWPSDELAELNASVAAADLVVVASPTYKASYTGLLKAFLDRYPNAGLAGTVAVPVMTGASELHAVAADVHLRPLLVELGASVPTRSLYFVMTRMAELDTVLDEWVAANRFALELVPTAGRVRP